MKAVVLEDREGHRAVFADAGFPVTRTLADVVAAQAIKALAMDRAPILIRGGGDGAARVNDAIEAIWAAAVRMAPVELKYDGVVVSVVGQDGGCVAAFFPVTFDGCAGGETVRSPVRAAFQIVDLPQGLLQRGQTTPSYAVQAIALGRRVTILGLGGEAPEGEFRAAGRMVVRFANDRAPWPDDARVRAAVESVLKRVR